MHNRRRLLFGAAFFFATTFKFVSAHAAEVVQERFNMEPPCQTANEKTPNKNPECYTAPYVEISLDDDSKLPFEFGSGHSLKNGPGLPPVIEQPNPSDGQTPGVGDIVNIFKWLWKFIEDNKAVVDVNLPPYAAALPKGITSGDELELWGMPKTLPFKLIAKNGFGMEVVAVRYSVQFVPARDGVSGQVGGHGKYLNNVTVVPREVKAAWGYRVDLNAKVLGVLNFGTKQDPIAGIQMLVNHRIKTQLKDSYEMRSYVVRGDGEAVEVLPEEFIPAPKPKRR